MILFKDGERFIGRLVSATGTKVVFRSNVAGTVTVDWSAVQELRSSDKFAVIAKGIAIKAPADAGKVPSGSIEMKEQTVAVITDPQQQPHEVPIANLAQVMGEKRFQSGFEERSFLRGWTGTATLGFNIVQGTSTGRTLSTMAFLERDDHPASGWLPMRFRTLVNFNSDYELATAFGEQTKLSRWHADVEQDFYVTARTFLFGGGMWEHNYTQGLELMQGYGGGAGYNLVKKEKDQLDIRGGIGFMHQAWQDPRLNLRILGSRFGASYTHTWSNGISFSADAGARPALNHSQAFFGGGLTSLTVPVYRHLKLSVNGMESFVNNPPPYFRKNLVIVNVGATYVVR